MNSLLWNIVVLIVIGSQSAFATTEVQLIINEKEQSPISIDDKLTKKIHGFVNFENYHKPSTFLNLNYKITMTNPKNITISATTDKFTIRNQSEIYKFENLHFHPGCSEHIINNVSYKLEAHLVHHNVKYESLDEAKNHKNGLLVIAVLLEMVKDQVEANCLIWDKITNSVNQTVNITLLDIFPRNWTEYYAYHGSLTTKFYEEIVQWIIIKKPAYICDKQLQMLVTGVKSHCRDTQLLNERPVYLVNTEGNASSSRYSFIVICLCIISVIVRN